jgi:hypothetical protein
MPRTKKRKAGLLGSTYDPELGGESPINYEALGIIPSEQGG